MFDTGRTAVARRYLESLDRIAGGGHDQRRGSRSRQQRAEDLSDWNALLIGRLSASDHEDLLDRLVEHPALAGKGRIFLQAHLARERGELETAVPTHWARDRTSPSLPELSGPPKCGAVLGWSDHDGPSSKDVPEPDRSSLSTRHVRQV